MIENYEIRIIIPFFNVEKYIGKCIDSIKSQKHENFTAYIYDDCSTDNSFEIAKSHVNNDKRFFLIKNKINHGALYNIVQGLKLNCENPSRTIDILIDGDDSLHLNDVLSLVELTYLRTKCLITYGTFIHTGGQGIFGRKYPVRTILNNSYRKDTWLATHLRTFRHDLWLKVKEADLKDDNGNFFSTAWDQAIMFPMLEMAGLRQECISDVLYEYNNTNPLCDHYINRESQLNNEQKIRSKSPYKLVDLG